MKFSDKNDNGMEITINVLEREILYRALELYAAEGKPDDFVIDNITQICEMENVLELPEFRYSYGGMEARKMREKLVELLENAKQENINLLNFESEIIADYLLQNGVVVLPCEVGDVVWYITGIGHKRSKKQ